MAEAWGLHDFEVLLVLRGGAGGDEALAARWLDEAHGGRIDAEALPAAFGDEGFGVGCAAKVRVEVRALGEILQVRVELRRSCSLRGFEDMGGTGLACGGRGFRRLCCNVQCDS